MSSRNRGAERGANALVLWNTICMQAALDHLRQQGEDVKEEDEARLSPLSHKHVNMLGHYYNL
ncbi:MAG: transposase [Candidatus Thiodiazotropha sp.]|nr:transposase [Candidatus Thiodiazotropha sp.]